MDTGRVYRKVRRDPQELGARCETCPFAKAGKPVNPVLGEGPVDSAPIGILVGEGPGAEEAEQGKPFVGATGRQLDISLTEAKLWRDKLFIVNAMCCRPTIGKTEDMMRRAVTCCRPVLVNQLKPFPESTPVFAMGKWAAFAMTGKDKGLMSNRGFIYPDFKLPREP